MCATSVWARTRNNNPPGKSKRGGGGSSGVFKVSRGHFSLVSIIVTPEEKNKTDFDSGLGGEITPSNLSWIGAMVRTRPPPPPPCDGESYLVLRDEAIGLDGLLPLEEDHVVERGEGQGL